MALVRSLLRAPLNPGEAPPPLSSAPGLIGTSRNHGNSAPSGPGRHAALLSRLMVGAGTHRGKQALAGGLAIVLVRPQLAVNIGMCARAMANFGLSDLRLVSPREGWPRSGALKKGAYAAAAGAVHLLERARLFRSVEEAVAELTAVYATTARERGQLKPVLTPAEAMPEMAARISAGEKHGVLFGPERTGLANE